LHCVEDFEALGDDLGTDPVATNHRDTRHEPTVIRCPNNRYFASTSWAMIAGETAGADEGAPRQVRSRYNR
jgi:hypothetical protein